MSISDSSVSFFTLYFLYIMQAVSETISETTYLYF